MAFSSDRLAASTMTTAATTEAVPSMSQSQSKKSMTDTEYILLSPFAKFSLHNRFPYKLALHSVLLLLVTSQVIVFSLEDSTFARTMSQAFGFFFMPNNTTSSPTTLYGLTETLDSLQSISDNFYTIQESSVASIGYIDKSTRSCYFSTKKTNGESFEPLPPSVTIALRDATTQKRVDYKYTNELVKGPIGNVVPFFSNENTFRQMMESLDQIDVVLSTCNVNTGFFFENCYEWEITVTYDFSNYANIEASIRSLIVNTCHDDSFEVRRPREAKRRLVTVKQKKLSKKMGGKKGELPDK